VRNLRVYDQEKERIEAASAKTLGELLLALRDACDELHALIAEPPAMLPPGQLDPRD
jgi:hypothetical protein